MKAIGLICEGPTDQVVLERLLEGIAGEKVRANMIQPPRPMRAGVDFGGWQQVFAAIRRKDVSNTLANHDFVVIQIDTDVCEEPGYDVPRRRENRELSDAELVACVVARLRAEIRTRDPDADLGRVAFAVCVNELECWLLLHIADREKTSGCHEACRAELTRRGEKALAMGLANKDPRAYEDLARDLRKPKAIPPLRGRSDSLDAFVAAVGPLLARAPEPEA
jgi:hypothetical protein